MNSFAVENDQQVGQILKAWRQHRRLSQMQLSHLADISTRHLSFIETGRAQASVTTLLSLAKSLEIPLKDQNHILLTAGFAPKFTDAKLTDTALDHARGMLEMILASHDPFPAFVVDESWNIILTNKGQDSFFSQIISEEIQQEVGGYNIMRYLFHPKGLCNSIVNWDDLWMTFYEDLKNKMAMQPFNEELSSLCSEISSWIAAQNLPTSADIQRPQDFAQPIKIHLRNKTITFVATSLTFAAPLSTALQGLTLETFYPKDCENTKEYQKLVL